MTTKRQYRQLVSTGILGAKTQKQISTHSTQLEEAMVIDVIVNNEHKKYADDGYNVGAIKFRLLNTDVVISDDNLHWAFPLNPSVTDYPLINELVYIISGLNRFFYIQKINTFNRVTANAFPEIKPTPVETVTTVSSPIKLKLDVVRLGRYFKDSDRVFRLKSMEGDIIYEGRSGQSMRFGAAWKDGDSSDIRKKLFKSTLGDQTPNILLKTRIAEPDTKTVNTPYGLYGENINTDDSSMWMVSDQIIPIDVATKSSKIHNLKVVKPTFEYNGSQIVMNSDRVIINTKRNELGLFSRAYILLSSNDGIYVNTDGNYISWVNKNREDRIQNKNSVISGGDATFASNKSTTIAANQNTRISAQSAVEILAKQIVIGGGGEPLVLGNQLVEFLSALIDVLVQEPIVLTTGVPGAPSPQNPARIAKLLQLKAQYVSSGPNSAILSLHNTTARSNTAPLTVPTIQNYSDS